MRKVRLLLGGISAILLTVGYLASQSAAMTGQAREYAEKVDRPEIVYLSLFFFLAALACFFVPDKEEPEA
jgi:hypothetical protein